MKKLAIISLIVLLLLIIFFYPKQSGYTKSSIIGYLGEEHRSCFGFKQVVNDCWPGFCTDAGTRDMCFGFLYGEPVCKAKIFGQNITYEEIIADVPCDSEIMGNLGQAGRANQAS